MNGLFSGLLGGASRPPMMPPAQGNGLLGMMAPGMSQKMQGWMGQHPQLQSMFSRLGNNAQSPFTQFGVGMMGGGGFAGGIRSAQDAMEAQKQQQHLDALKRMMMAQGGGLGGGGVMGGPAPASIY